MAANKSEPLSHGQYKNSRCVRRSVGQIEVHMNDAVNDKSAACTNTRVPSLSLRGGMQSNQQQQRQQRWPSMVEPIYKCCSLSICGGMEGMEAALHDDIVRVQSDRTGNIRVVLRTDSGETEAFVSPLDTVADMVSSALCTGVRDIESILLDGEDVSDGTFEDFGIESGARLTVIITRSIRTKAQVEALVDEIVACNPRANRAKMLRGAEFDADGNLQNWNLGNNGIASLPESFGSVQVGGSL